MKKIISYILSICFLLSGILKLVSLRSFEQEVQLYGDAYIGDWVHSFSFEIALLVCVAEIVAAIMALLRQYSFVSAIAFVAMLSFFVYLTGVNLFSPTIMGSIETCGCFGELIHFTPLSSFVKSVILFLIAVIHLYLILAQRNNREKENPFLFVTIKKNKL